MITFLGYLFFFVLGFVGTILDAYILTSDLGESDSKLLPKDSDVPAISFLVRVVSYFIFMFMFPSVFVPFTLGAILCIILLVTCEDAICNTRTNILKALKKQLDSIDEADNNKGRVSV